MNTHTHSSALTAAALSLALCATAGACRERPSPPTVNAERRDAGPSVDRDVAAMTDGSSASSDASADAPADVVDSPVMALPEAPIDATREPAGELSCAMDRGSAGRVPLPVVPSELRADVARYRLVVAQAVRCFEGYRVEHVGPQDCRAAVNTLRRGGLAAMHAVGQFIYDEQHRRLTRQERQAMSVPVRYGGMGEVLGSSQSIIDAAPTIAPLFGSFDAAEVVSYTLAALSHHARCHLGEMGAAGFVLWIETLGRVTGWDLTPLPPWQQGPTMDLEQSDRFAADAYVNWVRWYQAHKNESLDQWRAQGLERARRSLSGRDIATRVAAILRFARDDASAEDREAARRSLVQLLAERRLSNAGRRYLRERAAQIGWTLDESA